MLMWLSYQRYAMLLFGAALALAIGPLVLWPGAWWAWGAGLLAALRVGAFGVDIAGRHEQKVAKARRATDAVSAGTFEPDSVRHLAADPCSRVVAHDILRGAGLGLRERRKLLARYAAEEKRRGASLVLVDHERGRVFRVEGGSVHEVVPGASFEGGVACPNDSSQS